MSADVPADAAREDDERAKITAAVARSLARFAAEAGDLPPLLDVGPVKRRALFNPLALRFAYPALDGVARSERGPHVLHKPDAIDPRPDIVYAHGGGWVFLSPETHGRLCDLIAARTRRRVHVIRYSLAPEASFPPLTTPSRRPSESAVSAQLARYAARLDGGVSCAERGA